MYHIKESSLSWNKIYLSDTCFLIRSNINLNVVTRCSSNSVEVLCVDYEGIKLPISLVCQVHYLLIIHIMLLAFHSCFTLKIDLMKNIFLGWIVTAYINAWKHVRNSKFVIDFNINLLFLLIPAQTTHCSEVVILKEIHNCSCMMECK